MLNCDESNRSVSVGLGDEAEEKCKRYVQFRRFLYGWASNQARQTLSSTSSTTAPPLPRINKAPKEGPAAVHHCSTSRRNSTSCSPPRLSSSFSLPSSSSRSPPRFLSRCCSGRCGSREWDHAKNNDSNRSGFSVERDGGGYRGACSVVAAIEYGGRRG